MISTSANNNSSDHTNNKLVVIQDEAHSGLIQHLLYEIMRVKELIVIYDSFPNDKEATGSSILKELVTEAHNSLVNYDIILMRKYYDLLLNCD